MAFTPSCHCFSLFNRKENFTGSHLKGDWGEGEASMLSSTLNLFKGQVYFG